VTRRLVQTIVIFLVLTASTAAALLGLTLVTSANEAFYNSFAAHHGAHVAVTVNSSKVTAAQLAATRELPEVTQAAGPCPQTTITAATVVTGPLTGGVGVGANSQPLVTVGRASPGGPLDDLTMNSGRWAIRPGEIVLSSNQPMHPPLGAKIKVTSAPGTPQLTVVGFAGSPSSLEDAWVIPGQVATLRPRGAPATGQMLYTFTQASTAVQISKDVAAVKAVLPAGTVTNYHSWLLWVADSTAASSTNTPFVVAFALVGLVLAVLIVASVVSGAVVAAYRRIGVLKSIGFTPAQVVGAYVGQAVAPALAGCVAGAILGNLWVGPMLNASSANLYTGTQHVPLWINITAPLGMCVLVGVAALVPALRAGRLPAVAAIAAGQAPRAGRGYGAHRLAGRLPLPRPVTIGLAAPFTRPGRTAVTLAAITFGVLAVVLAVGLNSSYTKSSQVSALGQGQLQVFPAGFKTFTLTSSQDRAIEAALRAQPGTLHYVAQASGGTGPAARPVIGVSGLQLPLVAVAYNGDSAWLGWPLISGRWYQRTGEVDANTAFLTQTGRQVGDTVTLTVNGKPDKVRIVGQVYLLNAPFLFSSWRTLGGTAAGLATTWYEIGLKPGTSQPAYTRDLSQALGPQFGVRAPVGASGLGGGEPATIASDISLIRLLTLLVTVLAGLGVLSSVLMVTRERVHDLGVFKALGMTPRQTITMVICWVIPPAVAGAAIAVPAAIAAYSVTIQAIGNEQGTGIPPSIMHVYGPAELLLLAASGLAIAAAGALGPASWAAASRTVTALHAE
jgi:putative ABC transport system permease protein